MNKIVVGLGNPGEQYRQTRHNIGWMVLDRLADRAGWDGRGRSRDASTIVGGRFRGLDLLLAKPQTYMNDSGLAVRKLLARERAPLTELLVVVDDFALPFGKLRFREGGGPGGHNGLRSIIGEMGSEAFSRLRVGIGAPDGRFVDHVLTKFEPDERQRLDELLDAAADAVEAWAREGTNKAANRFNAVRAAAGGRGPDRAGGRGRRPTRSRRRSTDEDRLAPGAVAEATTTTRARDEAHPMSSSPPMRGKRGWERRLADPDRKVGGPSPEAAGLRFRGGGDRGPRRRPRHASRTRRSRAAPGPGRRIPNLSGLTRLVGGTGAFEALRERLGPIAAPASNAGRHAGVTSVPHGAKSYLAAALAVVSNERIVWIARDSEIGDRVAEELGAWVGDPETVAVLEPRTALAYERSELIADETAAGWPRSRPGGAAARGSSSRASRR